MKSDDRSAWTLPDAHGAASRGSAIVIAFAAVMGSRARARVSAASVCVCARVCEHGTRGLSWVPRSSRLWKLIFLNGSGDTGAVFRCFRVLRSFGVNGLNDVWASIFICKLGTEKLLPKELRGLVSRGCRVENRGSDPSRRHPAFTPGSDQTPKPRRAPVRRGSPTPPLQSVRFCALGLVQSFCK